MYSTGEMGDLLLRIRSIVLGGCGLLLISCLPAQASSGGNCVAYAREVTGIKLDGDAAAWWPHAEGRYERGQRPAVGAILVFRAYGPMRVGHVAVVSRVVGPREILVDQANWVRGRVTTAMPVVDSSPNNDWTSVKVAAYSADVSGARDNPTFGFIYPRAVPASVVAVADTPRQTERDRADRRADNTAQAPQRPRHDEPREANTRPDARRPHPEIARAETAPAPRKNIRRPAETVASTTANTIRHVAGNEPSHQKPKAKNVRLAYVY